jgi:mRNA interferase RelE/StbE
MSYSVRISESAANEIESLPKSEIPKILSKIEQLSLNPRPPGCKKLIGPEKLWRIRSGNYRIIYAIDDGIKIVQVRAVGNRKDIYK